MTQEQLIGYYKGNVFKYVFRAGKKGSQSDCLIDLEKASWYLNKLKALHEVSQ